MYDLIVIGAGAAGSNCAETVNAAGKRVALIERDDLGGTCLNYGCDPTKTALHSAKILYQAQQSRPIGLTIPEATPNWRGIQAYIQTAQQKMRGGTREEARQQMRERGIDLIIGEAHFVSAHELQVGDRLLKAEHILIATGTEPDIPEIPHLTQTGFLTNKTIFQIPSLPPSLAIIGGGPVGVEFAQLFARFGVAVSLFEADSHILPKDDEALALQLTELLESEGITIKTEAQLTAVIAVDNDKKLTIRYDSGYEEQFVVNALLISAGRKPAVAPLQLDAAGVMIKEGQVAANAALQTNIPHIWTAGDVTSEYPFTHTATRQGAHVAQNILQGTAKPYTSGPVPWVTYTDPELAHVGQTEKQLKEGNIPYHVLEQSLDSVARAIAINQTNGRVKLLIGEDDKILGGHILAPNGGDLLGPILLAMQSDLPVTALSNTVWPYPTLTTAIGQTASQHQS